MAETIDLVDENVKHAAEKTELRIDYFVDVLEKLGQPLFSKGQTPDIAASRGAALQKICAEILKEKKVSYTPKQISTKFYNLKSRTKKKADANRTGNQPIRLCTAEQRFWNLICGEENPALSKLKCKSESVLLHNQQI